MQQPHLKQQPPPLIQRTSRNDQESDTCSESIEDQELTTMITTLRKLKHIFKEGQLTALKKSRPKINQLFRRMSTFFLPKRPKRQSGGITKEQRRKIRQKRLATLINKNANKTFQNESFIQEVHQDESNMPQISESPVNSHPKQGTYYYLKCHICRVSYKEGDIHPFYGSLCPPCAQLNLARRKLRANMTGRTALVTGGRIKIGLEIALRLLRDGATVIVSSRFPNDTAARYESQKDFENWKDRLKIIQCDFISQIQVETLIDYVQAHVKKLDILINNAAQTIVRPKQFYHKELTYEQLAIEDKSHDERNIIKSAEVNPYPSVFSNSIALQPGQLDIGNCDEFGQPIDKRKINTWVEPIQNVSLLDCYTTQVVNSIVPFHLISKLKGKMMGSTPSWVINVSSMEGVFHRSYKSEHHPHTNMAKAALNMITRTCAEQFRRDGIFMNSVDTGWVTNENPLVLVEKMKDKYGFKCPLDCIDGAMRVLDPVYQGVLSGEFPSGHFLKNYKVHAW